MKISGTGDLQQRDTISDDLCTHFRLTAERVRKRGGKFNKCSATKVANMLKALAMADSYLAGIEHDTSPERGIRLFIRRAYFAAVTQ